MIRRSVFNLVKQMSGAVSPSAAVLFCMLPFVGLAFGQPSPDTLWTRVIGGDRSDYAYDIRQTADGGYIVAGYTSTLSGASAILVRLSESGDTLWTRSYRDEGAVMAMCVHEMPDGGFIFSGVGLSEHDTWQTLGARTNASGNLMWTTIMDTWPFKGQSIYPTVDGGSVIAAGDGFTYLPDIQLIKLDAGGDTVWTHYYGGPYADIVREVQQTVDGGYIFAGSTQINMETGLDLYLVRTNENGDTVWTRTFGGPEQEWGLAMDQCSDGGFVIAGELEYVNGPTDEDIIIAKTDSLGNHQWTRIYDGPPVYAESIEQTVDGGYIVCGISRVQQGSYADVYLLKLDTNGDSLWTRTYGGAYSDVGLAVRQTTDEGYVIAGYTQSFDYPDLDLYVIKTGPDLAATPQFHALPEAIVLHQNYPNPFNVSTRIGFDLPKAVSVKLKVFDLLGCEVVTLMDGVRTPGHYSIPFDGSKLPSGIYLYRLETGSLREVRKMVLLK
ncbi:MAG: PQQ-binding-like beta-propeller repeat protein [bacterium]